MRLIGLAVVLCSDTRAAALTVWRRAATTTPIRRPLKSCSSPTARSASFASGKRWIRSWPMRF